MAYPRTDCPTCKRNVAVTPRSSKLYRHDPPDRDPELKSCPGSFAFHHNPEKHGHYLTLFPIDAEVTAP